MTTAFSCLILALIGCQQPAAQDDAAARGYQHLRSSTYLPADFDQATFENLWRVWPEPLRSRAKQATAAQRRDMAFERYGLVPDPTQTKGPGLGYVSDGKNGWVMSCLACHSGTVAGKPILGSPNSNYGLQTLTEEAFKMKVRQLKLPSHLDSASLEMPLGTTAGSTNAVRFGVILAAFRKKNMDVNLAAQPPESASHDMDAPPFWNVKYKKSLYADGFAPKNERMLLQFMMLPSNSGERMRGWEPEFRDILAWIESLEPPKYPYAIDQQLASKGKVVFENNCARCHGTYEPTVKYTQVTVPLDEIGTDPVRLHELPREHREWVKSSWMSRYGDDPTETNPTGYVAPPLTGIWASAPYFHNGSVPTLWHVLRSEKRPAMWRRSRTAYDRERVGVQFEEFDKFPESITDKAELRRFFDTSKPAKSAKGHTFPDELTRRQKRQLLEYLKTL